MLRGGGATGEAQTTVNFQYDANGNLTADGTHEYTYDPLNRLAAVRSAATNQLVAQYLYDASGQRAAKITYTSGTASAYTQYLRQGSAVVLERTWSLPGPTAQSEKVYVYVAGTMAVTQQTTYATSSTTYTYYAVDHLGSVRATATVDSSGNYTAQGTVIHDFEPFGVEIAPTEPDGNTHDFTGQERDPETGNDYMHFRSFESAMGRFMRPDNINGTAMNPQSWNLYSYVHGNPVTMNDPTGHITKPTSDDGGKQVEPGTAVGSDENATRSVAEPKPNSNASKQEQPTLIVSARKGGRQGKGERGRTGSPKGTNNPEKKFRYSEKRRRWYYKDADGNTIWKGKKWRKEDLYKQFAPSPSLPTFVKEHPVETGVAVAGGVVTGGIAVDILEGGLLILAL